MITLEQVIYVIPLLGLTASLFYYARARGYDIHHKRALVSNAHWEHVKKSLGHEELSYIREIQTPDRRKPFWLTRRGIGYLITQGANIDKLDETASQLYSGEELEKIKIVLAFGRMLGPEGMNHLRNFELSELNLDSEMFNMLANNPDFLKIAELPIYKKLREVFAS